MVALSLWLQVWTLPGYKAVLAKLGVALLVLNEARGAVVAWFGFSELRARGVHLEFFWLAPLILIPIVVGWVIRRRRAKG